MNIVDRNQLPIKIPPITAYEAHANLTAVLLNYEKTHSWIYSNFIDLEVFKESETSVESKLQFYNFHIDYKNCPWINFFQLPRDLIKTISNDIIEFFIQCINSGYYIRTKIDRLYISNYKTELHGEHNILIFGYDKHSEQFEVADNFENGHYSFQKTSFNEIKNGFEAIYLKSNNENSSKTYLALMNFNNDRKFELDVESVVESISDYLESKNLSLKYRIQYKQHKKTSKFGMKCYDFLYNQINALNENSSFYGIRSFHALYDHKTIMLDRIKYFIDNGYLCKTSSIYESYSEVKEQSLIFRNLIIKYMITKNKLLSKKLYDCLSQIKIQEGFILEALVYELNKNIVKL